MWYKQNKDPLIKTLLHSAPSGQKLHRAPLSLGYWHWTVQYMHSTFKAIIWQTGSKCGNLKTSLVSVSRAFWAAALLETPEKSRLYRSTLPGIKARISFSESFLEMNPLTLCNNFQLVIAWLCYCLGCWMGCPLVTEDLRSICHMCLMWIIIISLSRVNLLIVWL